VLTSRPDRMPHREWPLMAPASALPADTPDPGPLTDQQGQQQQQSGPPC
jgi:hypothetical protein